MSTSRYYLTRSNTLFLSTFVGYLQMKVISGSTTSRLFDYLLLQKGVTESTFLSCYLFIYFGLAV